MAFLSVQNVGRASSVRNSYIYMYLRRLSLFNFRLYESLQLELQPGLNVFVGPNASGKTSLLEAIYVLSTTKSPRTNNDRELIRWGAQIGRVEGHFVRRNLSQALPLAIAWEVSPPKILTRRLEVKGVAVPQAHEFIGQAPVVMFTPDDLILIKGGPEQRRRFLNMALGQLQPHYLDHLSRYKRALQQRNELLKLLAQGARPPAEAHAWTEQLIQSGAALALARQRFIAALSAAARELHQLIAPTEQLQIDYHSELAGVSDEAEAQQILRRRLEELADIEVRRGTTLSGPHRDDLDIHINGIAARQFGSQGQQRTAALSLKLAQARVCQQWHQEPPLLLLDDCLSELDLQRARAVLDLGKSLDGLIVTSAKLDPVLQEYSEAQIFSVSAGRVTI